MGGAIRDAAKNTNTILKVVEKNAIVFPMPRPTLIPPGMGWIVEELPPRVIADLSSEGLRFTRTIAAANSGNGEPVTVIEEGLGIEATEASCWSKRSTIQGRER